MCVRFSFDAVHCCCCLSNRKVSGCEWDRFDRWSCRLLHTKASSTHSEQVHTDDDDDDNDVDDDAEYKYTHTASTHTHCEHFQSLIIHLWRSFQRVSIRAGCRCYCCAAILSFYMYFGNSVHDVNISNVYNKIWLRATRFDCGTIEDFVEIYNSINGQREKRIEQWRMKKKCQKLFEHLTPWQSYSNIQFLSMMKSFHFRSINKGSRC